MHGQSALARTRSAPSAPTTSSLLARTRAGTASPGLELRAIGTTHTAARAPLFTSFTDIEARANILAPHFDSLDRDVLKNLVWEDPAKLDADAAEFKNKATSSGVSTIAFNLQMAASLAAKAVEMRARSVGRGSEQIAREIAYAKSWKTFYDSWQSFRKDLHASTSATSASYWFDSPDGAWDRVNEFDVNFRNKYGEYIKLGYKPTTGLPPTSAEIEKAHPPKPLIGSGGALLDIPWTPILIIGGVLALAFLLPRLTAAKQAFVPSRTE